jgi:hypothetical protein
MNHLCSDTEKRKNSAYPTSMKRIAVVGGGLSGFAGVRGLIDSSLTCEITIFDHPNTVKMVEIDQDINLAKSHVQNGEMDAILHSSGENPVNHLPSSKIMGGWSNYWGATVMPWNESAISAANIDVISLHESYNAIGELLEYQAKEDSLRSIFPLFGKYTQRGAISPIASTLLDRFESCWRTQFGFRKGMHAMRKMSDGVSLWSYPPSEFKKYSGN